MSGHARTGCHDGDRCRITPWMLLAACLLLGRPLLAGGVQDVRASLVGGTQTILCERTSQLIFLSMVGVALLARYYDVDCERHLQTYELLPAAWTDFGNWYGGFPVKLLLLPACAGDVLVRGAAGSDWQRRPINAYAALGMTAVCTEALKRLTHRQRPDGSNYRSFPSGHTSSSFAVAAVLQQYYGLGVGLPAYGLATLSGLARMQSHRHYLSDVLFGAGLGILFGRAFGRWYEKDRTLRLSGTPDRLLVVITF